MRESQSGKKRHKAVISALTGAVIVMGLVVLVTSFEVQKQHQRDAAIKRLLPRFSSLLGRTYLGRLEGQSPGERRLKTQNAALAFLRACPGILERATPADRFALQDASPVYMGGKVRYLLSARLDHLAKKGEHLAFPSDHVRVTFGLNGGKKPELVMFSELAWICKKGGKAPPQESGTSSEAQKDTLVIVPLDAPPYSF